MGRSSPTPHGFLGRRHSTSLKKGDVMGTRNSTSSAVQHRVLATRAPRRQFIVGTALTGAALVLLAAVLASAALSGSGSYAPPASGAFAYNSFTPPLVPGTVFVDPVFG